MSGLGVLVVLIGQDCTDRADLMASIDKKGLNDYES